MVKVPKPTRADLGAFARVEPFAAYVDLGPALVRRQIKAGRIPCLYFGRCMRIPVEAALAKLAEEAEGCMRGDHA